MTTKTVFTVIVLSLSLVGCALPTASDELEETESSSSALHPRDDFVAPMPPRVPSFDRPIWDLTPYFVELHEQRMFQGNCVLRYVRLNVPGGAPVDVPVTECY